MSVQDRRDEDVAGGRPISRSRSAEPASLLTVRIVFTPSLPVIRLRGELDLASLHLLADALDSIAAAACSGTSVLLDLSGVTFCDVAGLRAIDMCSAALEAAGNRLVLHAPPPQVLKLIGITGVAQHLVRR